jgi:hypothetical protein
MGGPGVPAYAEIIDLARDVSQGIVTGDYRGAVATFIEYWNGPGAWESMRPAAQNALIRPRRTHQHACPPDLTAVE